MINIAPTETAPETHTYYDSFDTFREERLLGDHLKKGSVALHFQLFPDRYPGDIGYKDNAEDAVSEAYHNFVHDFAFWKNRMGGRIGRLVVPAECEDISEADRLAWLSRAFNRVQYMGETVRTMSSKVLQGKLAETLGGRIPNKYYLEYMAGVGAKTPKNDIWARYDSDHYSGDPSIIAVLNYNRPHPDGEATFAGCDAFVPPFPPGLAKYTDTLRDIFRIATPLPRLERPGQ